MNASLTVGIDARAAADERGGRGTYVRELLSHLAKLASPHRFTLYTRRPWQDAALGERFHWEELSAPDVAWHLATAVRANASCDVFLSTNSYLTAWFTRVPTVVVVFDLIPFVPGAAAQRRASWIERATIGRAVRRCSALAAISEATARDLIRRQPQAAGKTVSIPLAANERFSPQPQPADAEVLKRHGLRSPYVLALGTLEPRKNLPRLIEAFASLSPGVRGDVRLVVVGAKGWDTARTMSSLARHRNLVQALGHVADEDLAALYRQAELFCYPSLYEGFGLPVLEALRCGTPVLTSNRSSMPEVASEAGFYVDPEDVRDLRRGLTEALRDHERRRELAAVGLERARLFSWQTTAERTLALLERAAAGQGASE